MKTRIVFLAGLAVFHLGVEAWAQGRGAVGRPAGDSKSGGYRSYSPEFRAGFGFGRVRDGGYGGPTFLAQSYGWPGFNSGYPYFNSINPWYTQSMNYPYYYGLYYSEAARSKQEADEFEATLAREGKLTGPAKVGAFPTDFLPLRSQDATVTLDGNVQNPSSSGGPLVIGSGRHTLRIAAR